MSNVIDCVDLIVSEADLSEFEQLCDQWEKEQDIYNETEYCKAVATHQDIFYVNADIR